MAFANGLAACAVSPAPPGSCPQQFTRPALYRRRVRGARSRFDDKVAVDAAATQRESRSLPAPIIGDNSKARHPMLLDIQSCPPPTILPSSYTRATTSRWRASTSPSAPNCDLGGGASDCASKTIPAGHKIALRDIATGAVVLRYGQAIGRAKPPIRTGRTCPYPQSGLRRTAPELRISGGGYLPSRREAPMRPHSWATRAKMAAWARATISP